MRFLGGTAEKQMFHRVTRDDVVEDRRRPVGDCLDDKDVLGRTKGRVTVIFSVGAFLIVLVGKNLVLDHAFCLSRLLDILGVALYQCDLLTEVCVVMIYIVTI